MKKIIISVLGHDRPGIIAAVSKILFQQDCNIENVSQTIIQSEFAGIFIASVPDELSVSELHQALKNGLEPMGLYVHIKNMEHLEADPITEDFEPFIITVKGPDKKGLVAHVTEIIARYRVNVTNLQAIFKGGDDPRQNLMIYEVDISSKTNQHALREELRQKAQALGLDISIQHQNIFKAINRV